MRKASSKIIVARALTSKSRIGISAALSCEGCAAQWTIKSGLKSLNTLFTASSSLISISKELISGELVLGSLEEKLIISGLFESISALNPSVIEE